MRDEISFVVKQGFSCLDKGEERETSELSKPERITSLPALFVMSCEDPGEDSLIIRTSRNNMAKQPKGPVPLSFIFLYFYSFFIILYLETSCCLYFYQF